MVPTLLWAVILSCLSRVAQTAFLDGPHAPMAASTTSTLDPFNLWYFDLRQTNGLGAFQVAFYSGFPFGPIIDNAWSSQITGVLPNGTGFNFFAGASRAGSVTQTTSSGFSKGTWPGIGGWSSSEMGYSVDFNDNDGAISGQLTIVPVAPPHVPCASSSTFVGPGLGWTNAVPGAMGVVTFKFGNKKYTFSGSAYHDSNFANQPVSGFGNTWYWSRGLVGDFAFVFFAYLPLGFPNLNATDPNTWFTSGYLAKKGKVLTNFCSAEQSASQHHSTHLTISTSGNALSLPPDQIGFPTDDVLHLNLTYTIGQDNYKFQITTDNLVLFGGDLPYLRYTTLVKGGKVGQSLQNGDGYFDLIKLGEPQ